MQNISLQRISPYRARQMFDLVADVDRYSEFIPYCTASRVRHNAEILRRAIEGSHTRRCCGC